MTRSTCPNKWRSLLPNTLNMLYSHTHTCVYMCEIYVFWMLPQQLQQQQKCHKRVASLPVASLGIHMRLRLNFAQCRSAVRDQAFIGELPHCHTAINVATFWRHCLVSGWRLLPCFLCVLLTFRFQCVKLLQHHIALTVLSPLRVNSSAEYVLEWWR